MLPARGGAPALRPKDLIANFIKGLGKSSVEGGNRLTLLRDAGYSTLAEDASGTVASTAAAPGRAPVPRPPGRSCWTPS